MMCNRTEAEDQPQGDSALPYTPTDRVPVNNLSSQAEIGEGRPKKHGVRVTMARVDGSDANDANTRDLCSYM